MTKEEFMNLKVGDLIKFEPRWGDEFMIQIITSERIKRGSHEFGFFYEYKAEVLLTNERTWNLVETAQSSDYRRYTLLTER